MASFSKVIKLHTVHAHIKSIIFEGEWMLHLVCTFLPATSYPSIVVKLNLPSIHPPNSPTPTRQAKSNSTSNKIHHHVFPQPLPPVPPHIPPPRHRRHPHQSAQPAPAAARLRPTGPRVSLDHRYHARYADADEDPDCDEMSWGCEQ